MTNIQKQVKGELQETKKKSPSTELMKTVDLPDNKTKKQKRKNQGYGAEKGIIKSTYFILHMLLIPLKLNHLFFT